MDDLAAWLLKQLAMDEQSARAMPHAIENLQARWSPARLIADCDAKRRLIEALLKEDDCSCDAFGHHCHGDESLPLLALPYAHLAGYRQEWRP